MNQYIITYQSNDMPWPTTTIVSADNRQEALHLATDYLNAYIGVGAYSIESIAHHIP